MISETPSEGRHVVSSTLPASTLGVLEASALDVVELPLGNDRLIARNVKLDAGSFGSVRTLLFRPGDLRPYLQVPVALTFPPAATPREPDKSLLVEAIRYDPNGLQMPPTGKLFRRPGRTVTL